MGAGGNQISSPPPSAWRCRACCAGTRFLYPPDPDVYCAACGAALDVQERIAAGLAALVRHLPAAPSAMALGTPYVDTEAGTALVPGSPAPEDKQELAEFLDGTHAQATHQTPSSRPVAPDPDGEPELWTIEEVAAHLRCTVRAVYALRSRGALPAPDGPGRRLLWRADKIRQCRSRRVSPRTPPRSPR